MSSPSSIALIFASSPQGLIGRDDWMPWRLPDDLRHFKALTSGHALLMGRKTFAAIGKALPERHNLVLSRDPSFQAPGIEVLHDFQALGAWLQQNGYPKLFIAGGAQIYRLALPFAHRIHRTLVHGGPPPKEGDTLFPFAADRNWQLESARHHPADEKHLQAMTFLNYRRLGPPKQTLAPAP